jgi:hypothetical protein
VARRNQLESDQVEVVTGPRFGCPSLGTRESLGASSRPGTEEDQAPSRLFASVSMSLACLNASKTREHRHRRDPGVGLTRP